METKQNDTACLGLKQRCAVAHAATTKLQVSQREAPKATREGNTNSERNRRDGTGGIRSYPLDAKRSPAFPSRCSRTTFARRPCHGPSLPFQSPSRSHSPFASCISLDPGERVTFRNHWNQAASWTRHKQAFRYAAPLSLHITHTHSAIRYHI